MSANFSITGFIWGQLFTSLPLPTTRLTGRTLIVTGSNVGLGLEAARHMASLGAAKVILAVRTISKGETARESILQTTKVDPSVVEIWSLDLQSHSSVKAFADRVNKELPRLDVALLNAGVATETFKIVEGDESTITTNVTSTFLLGMLLLPKLKETAQTFPGAFKPHLTFTSSEVHFMTKFPTGKDALRDGTAGKGGVFGKLNDEKISKSQMGDRYNVSKLLEVYTVHELGEQTPNYPVIINCLNPGLCESELVREATGAKGFALKVMKLLLARSTEKGSRTLVHAAVDAGDESHGKYLSNCQVSEPATITMDADGKRLQKAVWQELSTKLETISPRIIANL